MGVGLACCPPLWPLTLVRQRQAAGISTPADPNPYASESRDSASLRIPCLGPELLHPVCALFCAKSSMMRV